MFWNQELLLVEQLVEMERGIVWPHLPCPLEVSEVAELHALFGEAAAMECRGGALLQPAVDAID